MGAYQNCTNSFFPSEEEIPDLSYRFSVGDPHIVIHTHDNNITEKIGDIAFSVISEGDQFYGFSGNQDTYLFTGSSVETLSLTDHKVLEPGDSGRFDNCGAWLLQVIKDGEIYRCWYHAETGNCSYKDNNESYASLAYAETTELGPNVRFTKSNYPQNQILIGHHDPKPGFFRGIGNGSMVKVGNYFYFYFMSFNPNWKVGVARSLQSTGGRPGTWAKYHKVLEPGNSGHNSQWNSNWNQGEIDFLPTVDEEGNLRSIGPPGAIASKHVKSGNIILVGTNNNGLQFAVSKDGLNFTRFVNDPLVFFDERSWQRTKPLNEHYHSSSTNHCYSNSSLSECSGYEYQNHLGFIRHKSVRKDQEIITQEIFRCSLSNNKYSVSVDSCSSGTSQDSLGHIYKPTSQPSEASRPLYLCYAAETTDYFLSHDENCESTSSQKEQFLGWILQEPTGDLLAYPSIVAPEGGNEFSGNFFYLFYTLVRRSDLMTKRTIVRRKVKIEGIQTFLGSKSRVKLMRYYNQNKQDHWTTTRLPTDEYVTRNHFIGWVYTRSFANSKKLVDCLILNNQKHIIRVNQCESGEEDFLRTIGWVHATEVEGLSPLYQCRATNSDNYLTGVSAYCENTTSHSEGDVLGYIDPSLPLGL